MSKGRRRGVYGECGRSGRCPTSFWWAEFLQCGEGSTRAVSDRTAMFHRGQAQLIFLGAILIQEMPYIQTVIYHDNQS